MNKDNLIFLLIASLLLIGMLLTIFFGGERSRHGLGMFLEKIPGQQIYPANKAGLDLGQRPARFVFI